MKTSLLNRTKIASVLVISFMVGVPSVVSAIDFFSSNNPTYFGVGYGKTKNKLDDFDGDKSDKGFIGFVGKRYNKNMNIEAFYTKQGKYEEEGNVLFARTGSVEVTAFGVKANYFFSQSNEFLPYATIGGANLDIKTKDLIDEEWSDGFKLVFGAGVQYKQSKDIILRLEYLDVRATTYIWGGVSTAF